MRLFAPSFVTRIKNLATAISERDALIAEAEVRKDLDPKKQSTSIASHRQERNDLVRQLKMQVSNVLSILKVVPTPLSAFVAALLMSFLCDFVEVTPIQC